jgi:hypothetical protein
MPPKGKAIGRGRSPARRTAAGVRTGGLGPALLLELALTGSFDS